MRTFLRQLGARQRISVGLILLVIAIVAVAKLLPHNKADSLIQTATPTGPSASSTQPALPAPAATAPSGPLLHSPVRPVTSGGASTPKQVAAAFTTAWLHHDGVSASAWLRAVTKYTTTALAAQLVDADPANVPADRTTGSATVVNDTATACQVRVPTDTGMLLLSMQRVSGRWLVDDIDWTRA
jgi:hypothetical protein